MKNRFIEKPIIGILSFLKDTVANESYALKKGLLQSIEPRVKIIGFLVFIIGCILSRDIRQLVLLYLICIFLATVSKIDLVYFLKRTWIFIPIFSFLIAIPALFDIFSPGETLFNLKIFGFVLIITKEGFNSAVLFVSRVAVSVSYIVLLDLTTLHTTLLKALKIFKIPKIFLMTLGMTYRYIYLFLEIIERTYLAIKSRLGGLITYRKGNEMVSWNISYLWLRSYALAQDVYLSMLSRGYDGEPRCLDDYKLSFKDIAWVAIVITICVAIFIV